MTNQHDETPARPWSQVFEDPDWHARIMQGYTDSRPSPHAPARSTARQHANAAEAGRDAARRRRRLARLDRMAAARWAEEREERPIRMRRRGKMPTDEELAVLDREPAGQRTSAEIIADEALERMATDDDRK